MEDIALLQYIWSYTVEFDLDSDNKYDSISNNQRLKRLQNVQDLNAVDDCNAYYDDTAVVVVIVWKIVLHTLCLIIIIYKQKCIE